MSHQDLVNLSQAINNLNPDAQVSATGIDDITWHVGTPTSKSELETEISRIETEYDAQEYARKRQAEYPSIQECVHAILDNDNNELDTLQAKRAEIKTKYPKGG